MCEKICSRSCENDDCAGCSQCDEKDGCGGQGYYGPTDGVGACGHCVQNNNSDGYCLIKELRTSARCLISSDGVVRYANVLREGI